MSEISNAGAVQQSFSAENEIDDEIDEEIDSNKLMAYDIAVFYNTYNLSTLLKWWGTKLIVPDFQRPYVWTIKQASEFVDSMLRGLPVPSMFFYDDNDNSRLLVVDGQQRLRSLYAFISEGKFGGKPFKLTGNIHPDWIDKTYDELDDVARDRLDDALLNITVMRQLAPDDGQSAMYLAFQRINTGGISLRAQEIRMAVSYGPLAHYLDVVSKDPRFDQWKFLRTDAQRQNENYSPIQELLLKIWTFYFNCDQFYGSSTREMIDEFFSEQKDFDKPKRRKPKRRYYSQEAFDEVFRAVADDMFSLTAKDLSPYSKPTQTYLEAIWVGLAYRKIQLRKDINREELSDYIRNWRNTVGDELFSQLFQARRTSSVRSAFERIRAGIEYFSGDF